MRKPQQNKEVDALNAAIVEGSRRFAYYGGMALIAAFLVLFFIAVFGRFLDTGAPRYLIPSVLWGAVAFFGVTAIWNRIKP